MTEEEMDLMAADRSKFERMIKRVDGLELLEFEIEADTLMGHFFKREKAEEACAQLDNCHVASENIYFVYNRPHQDATLFFICRGENNPELISKKFPLTREAALYNLKYFISKYGDDPEHPLDRAMMCILLSMAGADGIPAAKDLMGLIRSADN